jgi:hypothetical protein
MLQDENIQQKTLDEGERLANFCLKTGNNLANFYAILGERYLRQNEEFMNLLKKREELIKK